MNGILKIILNFIEYNLIFFHILQIIDIAILIKEKNENEKNENKKKKKKEKKKKEKNENKKKEEKNENKEKKKHEKRKQRRNNSYTLLYPSRKISEKISNIGKLAKYSRHPTNFSSRFI